MKTFLTAFFICFGIEAFCQVPPPPAASVAEVQAGTVKNKFVSPYTLANGANNLKSNAVVQVGQTATAATNWFTGTNVWHVNKQTGTNTLIANNHIFKTLAALATTVTNYGNVFYLDPPLIETNTENYKIPDGTTLIGEGTATILIGSGTISYPLTIGNNVDLENIVFSNTVIEDDPFSGGGNSCVFQDLTFHNENSTDGIMFYNGWFGCIFRHVNIYSGYDCLRGLSSGCTVEDCDIIGNYIYSLGDKNYSRCLDGDNLVVKNCRLQSLNAYLSGALIINDSAGGSLELDNVTMVGSVGTNGVVLSPFISGDWNGGVYGSGYSFTTNVLSNTNYFFGDVNIAGKYIGNGSGLTFTGTNTFTMGSTGYTNNNSYDVRIFELQGTSVVFTNLTSKAGFSLGTISVNNDFLTLHTNECVIGTGMSGKILQ